MGPNDFGQSGYWLVSLTAMLLAGCSAGPAGGEAGVFNVRQFGAAGDGKTLDTLALNRTIDAASSAGGGTVLLPAGVYLCHSLHLKNNVTIELAQGCVLKAAPPAEAGSPAETYDPPELNPFDSYQDFGHSHWHNSLIWGENLHDVAIIGPGEIDGSTGLVRGYGGPGAGVGRAAAFAAPAHISESQPVTKPTTMEAPAEKYPNSHDTLRNGLGNKAIALKLCRNVIIRNVKIFAGGHFAILATGVENLTIDSVKIDTNRDGMDIDCCRNVRVGNCTVNSPYDDGICLKACYALGYNKPCENVTVSDCLVCGYVVGTLLDGTCEPFPATRKKVPTGRIKLGTEANGGFRNIAINNCIFDNCSGLALEQVDGGPLEDVSISNITMRHVWMAPIFLRLGSRLRGPEGTPMGSMQRINISNIVAYDADLRYCSIISGIPGSNITDVQLSHIQIFCRGGGTQKWAATQSAEKPQKYPEPSMFGETGSYGFFVRHARGIEFNDVKLRFADDDQRPAFVLEDVGDADLVGVDAQHLDGVPIVRMKRVSGLQIHQSAGLNDGCMKEPADGDLPAGMQPSD